MATLMSQAEYAAHRGVGKPAVSNWKKRGLLVLCEDANGRVMVDVARSDARINARVDPMRGRPSGSAAVSTPSPSPADTALPLVAAAPAGTSLADARLEHLFEQKIGTALKNAQTARELVPLVEYERRMSETGRLIRERVQSAFRGMAERLAVERDPRVIMSIGEDEFDRVFADLADDAEAGMFDDDDADGDEAVGAIE